MSNPLKTILCLVLIVCGCATSPKKESFLFNNASEHPSVELQLLDVHLGTPYAKVKAELTKKYGAPIKSESIPAVADTFKLSPKDENELRIVAKPGNPPTVDKIFVSGTKPIPGLNFFSNANLGDSEDSIRYKFPKAEMEQRNGFRRYSIPFANYFLDVENGKVTTLGIWGLFIVVKGGNDSIALSPNLIFIAGEKELFSKKEGEWRTLDMPKLKALADDPLRPYCKERYPLRQAIITGKAYIDVNVFKNKQEPPVPATFLVDTGWSVTSVSAEICKKVSCKYADPTPSEEEKRDPTRRLIWVGGIEIGTKRDPIDLFPIGLFTLMPSGTPLSRKDGVMGITTLIYPPLFINFKHGYLCYPTLPIPEVARKLKFSEPGRLFSNRGLRTDFYVNNQRVESGLLDSGADTTYLSKKNISLLKLRDLNRASWHANVHGWYHRSLYGPVEIGWPSLGITQNLNEIAEADESIIGMDFLRHTILGIDLGIDLAAMDFLGFYIKK